MPTPSTPPTAPPPAEGLLHGLSFQQLLLLAFVLIAGLLGVSSLRALHTLEQLMVLSRHGTAEATALTAAAQGLNQRGQALERAARQSLVLRDAPLRRSFDDMAVEALTVLDHLQAAGLPAAQTGAWRTHLDAVKTLLDAPPDRALDNERLVAEEFVALETLHGTMVQTVQDLNTQRNNALQDEVEQSRRSVTHQVVGAIVLALVLALSLGIWLARPFKRLEGAIRQLGENQLDEPVLISGPDDVRRFNEANEGLQYFACLYPEVVSGQKSGKKSYAVYSAPDTSSYRAAKGKASVSTGDDYKLYLTVGDWSLIEYRVSLRTSRFGWAQLGNHGDETTEDLVRVPMLTAYDTYLTDDPNVSEYHQAELPAGTKLTALSNGQLTSICLRSLCVASLRRQRLLVRPSWGAIMVASAQC